MARKRRTVTERFKSLKNDESDHPEPRGLPVPFETPLDKPPTAAILGITVSGLDKLISTGKAPPFFRVGRRIRWNRRS